MKHVSLLILSTNLDAGCIIVHIMYPHTSNKKRLVGYWSSKFRLAVAAGPVQVTSLAELPYLSIYVSRIKIHSFLLLIAADTHTDLAFVKHSAYHFAISTRNVVQQKCCECICPTQWNIDAPFGRFHPTLVNIPLAGSSHCYDSVDACLHQCCWQSIQAHWCCWSSDWDKTSLLIFI
jgi:hypothetical protein